MKERDKEKSKEFDIDPVQTWLNGGIKTVDDLKEYLLTQLGYPLQTVELDDSQLNVCIASALRVFSKYYWAPEKYLMLNLKFYKPGVGIDLSNFNVMNIKDIGFQRDNMMGYGMDMFFSPYAYFGQGTGFGPMFGSGNGNAVGSWVTWQNLNEFFDLSKRMTGSNPDWVYDRNTKILKLMPEPKGVIGTDHFVVATCQVQPPIEEYFNDEYFLRLCLAECKILLGTIRKKFQGVQLLGGGQIDTEIGSEGKEEKDKLIEEIMNHTSKGWNFYLS